MSIFKETFRDFVFNQLKIREAALNQNSGRLLGRPKVKDFIGEAPTLDAGAFYTNTTSRQCVIRMSSGADLKAENNLLNANEKKGENLLEEGLAIRYMLEGGIPAKDVDFISNRGNDKGTPENPIKVIPRGKGTRQFTKGKGVDYGSAYGDSYIRSEAADGFGIVPMPGIIDAEIRTKTAYGSLRDAKINFVCHNRRQLDILDTLYMRPGMPILLEWGWDPYISNLGKRESYFPYLWEWFDQNSSINEINEIIHDRIKAAGGNYDGFIGYIKNFEITSRPDGGYDCTTELAAMGEVLEGLKGKSSGFTLKDEVGDTNVEVDNLEFILKMLREWAEIIDTLDNDFLTSRAYNIEINAKFTPNLAKFIQLINDKIVPELGKQGTSIDFLSEQEEVEKLDINEKTQTLKQETKKGIIYLKEILDPYIIYKGEALGLKGDEEVDRTGAKSAEYYIKWELLSIFLNKLVFNTYQEGAKISPLTEITWLDEAPNTGPKLPLQYSKYTFKNDAHTEIPIDSYIDSYGRFTTQGFSEFVKVNISDLMDMSVEPFICLLPHQLDKLSGNLNRKFKYEKDINNAKNAQRIVEVDNKRNISDIFIGLDYLVELYKKTRYKGDEINEDFNLFTFLQTIWEKDINNACVGTHNFIIHTEKTRGNILRIIDIQSNTSLQPEDLYKFKTHGKESIVRDFNYNTTIDSKLSSTVSIAAQSPNSIGDLDAESFAAFNRNIKYRFFKEEEEENGANINKKGNQYDKDLEKLQVMLSFLYNHRKEMLRGEHNSGTLNNGRSTEKLAISTAKRYIQNIESSIISLKLRYSESKKDDKIYKGFRKKSPSNISKSTVIPLKFNAQIDGISGLVIGNVFKIDNKFLPKGYQEDDIAFVVMTEGQKITAGQDWTTDFSGQMMLLDLPKKEEWDDLKFGIKANTAGITKDISYYEFTDENTNSSQIAADPNITSLSEGNPIFLKVNSDTNVRTEPILDYETKFNDNIIRVATNNPIGTKLGIVLNKKLAPSIESNIKIKSGFGEQQLTDDDKSVLQWRTETDYEGKNFEVVYKDSKYPVQVVINKDTPTYYDPNITNRNASNNFGKKFYTIEDFKKGDYYWIPEGILWSYKKPIQWLWFLIKFENDINFDKETFNDDWDDVKDPDKNTQYTINNESIQGGKNDVKIGWMREDVLRSF